MVILGPMCFVLDSEFWILNSQPMPKWVKLIVAIVLLPVCVGAAWALWLVLRASGSADTTWVPLIAGFVCWLVIYLLLPRPMWVYVFGHELTHALWTWACGGQVKQFKATAEGGHVIVSKTNFIIALAPHLPTTGQEVPDFFYGPMNNCFRSLTRGEFEMSHATLSKP